MRLLRAFWPSAPLGPPKLKGPVPFKYLDGSFFFKSESFAIYVDKFPLIADTIASVAVFHPFVFIIYGVSPVFSYSPLVEGYLV